MFLKWVKKWKSCLENIFCYIGNVNDFDILVFEVCDIIGEFFRSVNRVDDFYVFGNDIIF